MINYVITAVYILCTTSGLFLFKLGGDTLSFNIKNGVNFSIGHLTLCGFILYLVSFLLWQKLLVTNDLSYIVPITTGIVQIIILLIGHYFFHEVLTLQNIVGIILIIAGIILISKK